MSIEHAKAPHTRILQKRLGEEVTLLVHGKEEFEKAVAASEILFGNSTTEDLKLLDEQTFLDVFDGIPQALISSELLSEGISMVDALAAKSNFLSSNGEAKRALKENGIAVNKEKVPEDFVITKSDLIAEKYVLLQRGKKSYFLLRFY